ncbi:hypothetical protein [Maridesulfovibrio sp.]|uniref:hypothetical protein n=1 Tax=Maridesulfovibrio sp. TaxID=2795000 RepID=UPI0029C9EEB8|nr:hypothetical protein [Maridesulfovibrio sp.]
MSASTTTHFGWHGVSDGTAAFDRTRQIEMRVNRWLKKNGYDEVCFEESQTVNVIHDVDYKGPLHTVVRAFMENKLVREAEEEISIMLED